MAIIGTYDIGDAPSVYGAFTDLTGTVPTSPSAVTVLVKDPSGTETAYISPHAAIVIGPAAGLVTFTFPTPLNLAGQWSVRMKGTAGLVAAVEGQISVANSAFIAP